jgi:hypothetical protein
MLRHGICALTLVVSVSSVGCGGSDHPASDPSGSATTSSGSPNGADAGALASTPPSGDSTGISAEKGAIETESRNGAGPGNSAPGNGGNSSGH